MPGFPAHRRACFYGGMAVVALALASPLATYSDRLFYVHMIQHLVLVFGAAPLIVLGAPLALLARRFGAVRSLLRATRRLHRFLHPVLAWLSLGVVMWASHLSALYNAALENQLLHGLEHALYLAAAVFFWSPVIAVDVGPRLSHPARLLYLLAALPQQSFLGLAVYSASSALYPHYTYERAWEPSPLDDQRLGGTIMWIAGDFLFVAAIALAVGAWMRSERLRETAS